MYKEEQWESWLPPGKGRVGSSSSFKQRISLSYIGICTYTWHVGCMQLKFFSFQLQAVDSDSSRNKKGCRIRTYVFKMIKAKPVSLRNISPKQLVMRKYYPLATQWKKKEISYILISSLASKCNQSFFQKNALILLHWWRISNEKNQWAKLLDHRTLPAESRVLAFTVATSSFLLHFKLLLLDSEMLLFVENASPCSVNQVSNKSLKALTSGLWCLSGIHWDRGKFWMIARQLP